MISVIIPIYNKQKALKKCIDSVCNQSYTNWELLLIDDGSVDDSAKYIQSYLTDSRIHYFYKKNGGVSSARNLGIKKAKGEWIIFLDADDYFLPHALEHLFKTSIQKDVLVCTSNFWMEYKNKKFKYCWGKSHLIQYKFRSLYFRNYFPRAGNTLFHISTLKNVSFDENLSRYEDLKFIFAIIQQNSIYYTKECVMVYSLDNIGLSKPSSDCSKDYIFCMEFEKHKFWRNIILTNLLNQGLRIYPHKRETLLKQYKTYKKFLYLEKILFFMVKVQNKIRKIFEI